MAEDSNAVTLEEALAAVVQDLPRPLREFVLSERRNQIARDLTAKYHLHIDQAAEFENAYLQMLLGVSRPDEFAATLSKAGLGSDVINGLAADLNELVFIPLRNAELRPETPVQPVPAQRKPEPLPPPALDYQPAQTLPGSPVPVPAPAPVSTLPAAVPVAAPVQHIVHTSHGQQAGWHPAAAVHIFVPTHGTPAQQAPAVPATEVPAETVQQPIVQQAPAETPIRRPDPQPAQSPSPIQREYANDPYREPI